MDDYLLVLLQNISYIVIFLELTDFEYFKLPPSSANGRILENAVLTSSWVKPEFFQPLNYIYFWGFVNQSMVCSDRNIQQKSHEIE